MDNALCTAENDDYLFLLHYILSLDKYRYPYRQPIKRAIKEIFCLYKDKFQLNKKEFQLFATLYSTIFRTKQMLYTLNGTISANAKLDTFITNSEYDLPWLLDDGTQVMPKLQQLVLIDCKLNLQENKPFYEPLDQLLGCCFGQVIDRLAHHGRTILVSEQIKLYSCGY